MIPYGYSEQHPDIITDWKSSKKLTRGGRQVAEDTAIDAYLKVWGDTKDEDKAGQAYSEVYKKILKP